MISELQFTDARRIKEARDYLAMMLGLDPDDLSDDRSTTMTVIDRDSFSVHYATFILVRRGLREIHTTRMHYRYQHTDAGRGWKLEAATCGEDLA